MAGKVSIVLIDNALLYLPDNGRYRQYEHKGSHCDSDYGQHAAQVVGVAGGRVVVLVDGGGGHWDSGD